MKQIFSLREAVHEVNLLAPKRRFMLWFLTLTAVSLLMSNIVLAVTVKEVASMLVCQCGCDNMIVSDCNCGSASQTRALIQTKIDNGQTKDAILSDFAKQYGEKVLASPSKSGFNLTAWIMPFAALVVAAGAVTMIITTWVKRSQQNVEQDSISISDPAAKKYKEQLKRELENFD